VQLTNDGLAKTGSIETDGSRLYFNEGPGGSFQIVQVSVTGGQTGVIPTNLVNPQSVGLTADGASLLVEVSAPIPTQVTLWSIPLPAGDARRLGDAEIDDASLFPDGHLIYILGNDVFTADKDGSNPHKLSGVSAAIVAPSVSPDGKKIAFSAIVAKDRTWVINEASSDGTGVHPILKGAPGLPAAVCCLRWTRNAKYVLFGGQDAGRTDIWALSEDKPLLRGSPTAVRLTNGPVSYDYFASSRDSNQIFAIGAQRRGELVRYDSKVHAFVPFLGGVSAYDATFSRDGKWIAYLSYPEHILWRSRADGSDRLQLTYPPMVVEFPRISPDGTKVAFSTEGGNAYVVSMENGKQQKIIDNTLGQPVAPDWSPDGNLLAFTFGTTDSQSGTGHFESRIFDTRTGRISPVPDSKGTIGPWFATQDTLIATSFDQSKFVLFDFRTGKWADLIASVDKFANWEMSPDGNYFFYQTAGNNPKIFRMRMKDRVVEEVASLKGFRPVKDPYLGNTQLNVTPDNSPVLTRDIGTQEVYALTVKWP
jgi:Tol biopolymer transport system component